MWDGYVKESNVVSVLMDVKNVLVFKNSESTMHTACVAATHTRLSPRYILSDPNMNKEASGNAHREVHLPKVNQQITNDNL